MLREQLLISYAPFVLRSIHPPWIHDKAALPISFEKIFDSVSDYSHSHVYKTNLSYFNLRNDSILDTML